MLTDYTSLRRPDAYLCRRLEIEKRALAEGLPY
jgi:hypothetical protein